jgi:hypothetical protein
MQCSAANPTQQQGAQRACVQIKHQVRQSVDHRGNMTTGLVLACVSAAQDEVRNKRRPIKAGNGMVGFSDTTRLHSYGADYRSARYSQHKHVVSSSQPGMEWSTAYCLKNASRRIAASPWFPAKAKVALAPPIALD